MRYILAVIFVCAVGAPAACALPIVGPDAVTASKADPIVQVAKRKRAPQRQSRGDGGIHPLVGSGGY